MIYLLHGDDTVASRTYLLKLKEAYDSSEVVDAKTLLKNPDLFLASPELFSSKKLLIVENYTPKENEGLSSEENIDLVFWTDDLVSTVPKWVNKALSFKIPDQALTFKFIDSLTSGQDKQAFLIFNALLAGNTPSELIIGSLTRQLRLLTLGLEGDWEKVSKSSFVQEKIREQLKNWNRKKIRAGALLVLKADWEIKSGSLKAEQAWTLLITNFLTLAKT